MPSLVISFFYSRRFLSVALPLFCIFLQGSDFVISLVPSGVGAKHTVGTHMCVASWCLLVLRSFGGEDLGSGFDGISDLKHNSPVFSMEASNTL